MQLSASLPSLDPAAIAAQPGSGASGPAPASTASGDPAGATIASLLPANGPAAPGGQASLGTPHTRGEVGANLSGLPDTVINPHPAGRIGLTSARAGTRPVAKKNAGSDPAVDPSATASIPPAVADRAIPGVPDLAATGTPLPPGTASGAGQSDSTGAAAAVCSGPVTVPVASRGGVAAAVTGVPVPGGTIPVAPSGNAAPASPVAALAGKSPAAEPVNASDTATTPILPQGEKFAESGGGSDGRRDSSGHDQHKKILNVLNKQVAEADPLLGTDGAKTAANMSAALFSRHLPATGSESVGPAPMTAPAPVSPAAPVADASPASAAHRTVEAVLAAADRLGTEGHSTVNLQFSLSGADLAVRVQLRDGAVHATFRTDSNELRSALAHEWQAVSSETPDHPLRLAEPVFAARDGSGFGSPAGDNAAQQREPGARQTSDAFPTAASRAGSRSFAATLAADPVAAADSVVRGSNLALLHAFA